MALAENRLGRGIVETASRTPLKPAVERVYKWNEKRRLEGYMEELKKPETRLPNHVFIIPDGNRRGAESMGLSRLEGHALGAKVMWKTIPIFQDLNIPNVTVWVWSEDNEVRRGIDEREKVFDLVEDYLPPLVDLLNSHNAKFVHRGRKDRIPESLREALMQAEEETSKNTGNTVGAAIDYDWKYDMAAILRGYRDNSYMYSGVNLNDDLAEELFKAHSPTPPVDCLIRTSGELRESGLGLVVKDAEFISIKKFLTHVSPADFAEALLEFSRRQRRGGK